MSWAVELEHDQVRLNQESVNLICYLIVVIYGVKNELKVVGDHIKSICGSLDVNLIWA